VKAVGARGWPVLLVLFAGAACSSGKVSLGDDGTGLRNVAADEVVVAIRACATGAAHPNVCCSGDPCTTHDLAPFAPCRAGETSYPDGQRCCDLESPSSCTACDPTVESCGTSNSGLGAPPPPVTSVLGTACEHCPPGFTGTSLTQTGCCKSSGSSSFCEGAGTCLGDGCPTIATCTPTCAPGFSQSATQADVCCRPGASRDDCYVWLPGDATALSCGGAASSCACRRSDGTHAMQMDCDDATSSCTCSVDGIATSTVKVTKASCTTQDTRTAAWVDACRFTR
jgi:hypothetical protein